MDKSRIVFIINPKSGVTGKKSIPEIIGQNIDRGKFDYTISFTEYAGHATELAAKAVEDGYSSVVAVGGDGTVNEVARSLVGTKTALGVLPCGSGNGFARHLGIPMNLRKAVEFINSSEPVSVDYGKMNGRPFFCTCGMGFDAKVSQSFAEGGHRGLIGYINKTLHEYIAYEPDLYEIEDEHGLISEKAFLIACGNAAQYGNNFYIAPNASMKDGLLSVTVLEPFPTIDVVSIIRQVLEDTIDRNSHIKTFSSRYIKIRRGKPGAVHFDGEPMVMGTEILIETVPDGLYVLSVPGWKGSYEPTPVYKRLLEVVGV